MSASANIDSSNRLGGLDGLRIGAMALVTMQHVFSLTGKDSWSNLHSLNFGQLGVAIFLSLSAFLACASRRPPIPWFVQRLGRLYPPYWLVMVGCFWAAGLSHYKQFDFFQVLSQMLGLGLFTHAHNLINVPTWFISILLVCYGGLFIIRLSRQLVLANLIFLALIVAWLASSGFKWPYIHLVSFFATSTIMALLPQGRRDIGFSTAGITALLLTLWSEAFVYTAVSLILVSIALKISKVPRFVTTISNYCYEYYLVHGVTLVLTTSALRNYPVVAAVCGILLAAVGAVIVKRITEWLVNLCLSRFADRSQDLKMSSPVE